MRGLAQLLPGNFHQTGIIPAMYAVCIAPGLVGSGGRVVLVPIIKALIPATTIAVAPNVRILEAGTETDNTQNEQYAFHINAVSIDNGKPQNLFPSPYKAFFLNRRSFLTKVVVQEASNQLTRD